MGLKESMTIIEAKTPEEFHTKYEEFKATKIRLINAQFKVVALSNGEFLYSVLIITGR